ncbi:hypothetical protein NQZ68_031393 [Dissostichus eleginoides]|nr:hypothetical protein NQZ68_031393 [Dissostichus eleginoides]
MLQQKSALFTTKRPQFGFCCDAAPISLLVQHFLIGGVTVSYSVLCEDQHGHPPNHKCQVKQVQSNMQTRQQQRHRGSPVATHHGPARRSERGWELRTRAGTERTSLSSVEESQEDRDRGDKRRDTAASLVDTAYKNKCRVDM